MCGAEWLVVLSGVWWCVCGVWMLFVWRVGRCAERCVELRVELCVELCVGDPH